ncbi:NADPH-dependent FMN reductase [Alteribacter natronophilus]|uniref:NADPH-dependent FMN reductase n=1 Tax=Alteribacter natronophilus TaxID=2583810 RepID=UPI00110DC9F3|nr:NAD(P)H-dependent oxidoreductase [Alteribacter natronophilus]TMW72310.1 NAD(P)H-dependent oxidoreductase [Alteribacter natronophilus]
MKILGISGTILGSKTAVLVESVLKRIEENNPEADVELLDLRDYEMEFCDGRPVEKYGSDTREIVRIISEADAYLVGTPIFNGSIPAPLKNVFDLVPPAVFRHKVMGFAANGGTFQHYLVIENQLKPIAGYLRCFVAPGFVYAQQSCFNDQNVITDQDLLGRIDDLAEEMLRMQSAMGRTVQVHS